MSTTDTVPPAEAASKKAKRKEAPDSDAASAAAEANLRSHMLFAHLLPIVGAPRIYNNSTIKKPNYQGGENGNVVCDMCGNKVYQSNNYISCDALPRTDVCESCFKILTRLSQPYVSPPSVVVRISAAVAAETSTPASAPVKLSSGMR